MHAPEYKFWGPNELFEVEQIVDFKFSQGCAVDGYRAKTKLYYVLWKGCG